MRKNLTTKEILMVASLLFGMFFGAGNLIFPIHMGQEAGSNIFAAFIGFILTGAGLPLLSVVAFGRSHSESVYEMASPIGKRYATLFTCAMYLAIGPLVCIPRCATVSYTIGLEPLLGTNPLALGIFSALFFSLVLFFTLRPGRIIDWIGKYLNPTFLLFFCTLLIIALLNPLGEIKNILPTQAYQHNAFFKGFLEGYNTLDALAGLAFGVVVINTIKGLGVEKPELIAKVTLKAGVLACLLMAILYGGACTVGAQSRGYFELSANGGVALASVCWYYLGRAGQLFLAVIVTLACLKTSIGLTTSIGEAFADMFTNKKYYREWAIGFCLFSFIVSNVGLSLIISFAIPVLVFLYPLAMTLIILAIIGNTFNHDKRIYISVTLFTLPIAFLDVLHTLNIKLAFTSCIPLFDEGIGWIIPSLIGFSIGLFLYKTSKNNNYA